MKAVLAGVLVTIVTMMPAPVLGANAVAIQADIPFAASQLGLMVMAFYMAAGAASPVAGRMIDGRRAAVAVATSLGLLAAAAGGIALVASTWQGLVAWMVVAGAGAAVGHPAANVLIITNIAQHRRGTAFGLKQVSAPIASMLAGFSVILAAGWAGWRGIFFLLVLMAFLLVPAALGLQTDLARPKGRGSIDRLPVVVLAVAGFFAGGATTVFGAFLVIDAVARGLSISAGGMALGLASGLAILTRVVVGWIADRRRGHYLTAVAALLGIGSLGMAGIALTSTVAGFLGAVAVVGSVGWGWNGLFQLAIVKAQLDAPGMASGVTQTGQFFGGALGPLLFGLLADAASFRAAWALAAAWMVLAAVLVLASRELFRQRLTSRTVG